MRAWIMAFGLFLIWTITGCGTTNNSNFNPNGDGSVDPDADPFALKDGGGEASGPCQNLQCQQVTCTSGETTITGVVYDPKGTTPLYNVFVYVPNKPLDPITTGPVCTACQAPASGFPVVSTSTDERGRFVLKNVPVGTNIPLVMQLGKWRRHVVLNEVKQCTDNVFNTRINPGQIESLLRLPKKQGEGSPDDNIPKIAYTSGCDYAECFLASTIGIDPSEFGGPSGNTSARVQMYRGQGGYTEPLAAGAGNTSSFWNNLNVMKQFDIIMSGCECNTFDRLSPQGYANLKLYLEGGGRFFSTHYYYNFFASSSQCNGDATCKGPPDFNSLAQWKGDSLTITTPPYTIDMTFPRGKAMGDWLKAIDPASTLGKIDLSDTRSSVGAVTPGKATRWIYDAASSNTLYLSFNAPVGVQPENQCGRAVFSDVHLSGTSYTTSGGFPNWCSTRSSNDQHVRNENALEFLFFDLSSCVQDDTKPPLPPPN
ncbi:hypothetical protein BH09MYX1_BH09MYX1_20560 [soil metagenome]